MFGQRFAAGWIPVGGEFQLSIYTSSNQKVPAVAMSAGGTFVALWEVQMQDVDVFGIFAQRYDDLGNPQ